MPDLKPPEGYDSWLAYAIDTMDTRSLYNQQIMDDNPYWGEKIIQRDEMRDAAQAELDKLKDETWHQHPHPS